MNKGRDSHRRGQQELMQAALMDFALSMSTKIGPLCFPEEESRTLVVGRGGNATKEEEAEGSAPTLVLAAANGYHRLTVRARRLEDVFDATPVDDMERESSLLSQIRSKHSSLPRTGIVAAVSHMVKTTAQTFLPQDTFGQLLFVLLCSKCIVHFLQWRSLRSSSNETISTPNTVLLQRTIEWAVDCVFEEQHRSRQKKRSSSSAQSATMRKGRTQNDDKEALITPATLRMQLLRRECGGVMYQLLRRLFKETETALGAHLQYRLNTTVELPEKEHSESKSINNDAWRSGIEIVSCIPSTARTWSGRVIVVKGISSSEQQEGGGSSLALPIMNRPSRSVRVGVALKGLKLVFLTLRSTGTIVTREMELERKLTQCRVPEWMRAGPLGAAVARQLEKSSSDSDEASSTDDSEEGDDDDATPLLKDEADLMEVERALTILKGLLPTELDGVIVEGRIAQLRCGSAMIPHVFEVVSRRQFARAVALSSDAPVLRLHECVNLARQYARRRSTSATIAPATAPTTANSVPLPSFVVPFDVELQSNECLVITRRVLSLTSRVHRHAQSILLDEERYCSVQWLITCPTPEMAVETEWIAKQCFRLHTQCANAHDEALDECRRRSLNQQDHESGTENEASLDRERNAEDNEVDDDILLPIFPSLSAALWQIADHLLTSASNGCSSIQQQPHNIVSYTDKADMIAFAEALQEVALKHCRGDSARKATPGYLPTTLARHEEERTSSTSARAARVTHGPSPILCSVLKHILCGAVTLVPQMMGIEQCVRMK